MTATEKRHVRRQQSVPLYLQIAENLKERILNKEFPCGTSLPAESRLAASYDVTHLTLRKSLQILKEQNLIVQQHGRGTYVTYSHDAVLKVGYLAGSLDRFSGYYDLRIISEFTRQFSTGKGNLLLMSSALDSEEVLEKLHQNQCSALLVTTMDNHVIDILNSAELKHIPVCCLNVWSEHLHTGNRCYVGSKPGGIQKAISYLTGLGHRKIAYISQNYPGLANDCGLKERNSDFLSSHLPEGICFIGGEEIVWHDWARQCMHRIAAMPQPERPTAVILPGISFAAGAWLGALESGLKIPDDISLISIDCAPDLFPRMTTVEQALESFVEKAISLFNDAELTGGLIQSGSYSFDLSIIERGSCCKLE